MVCVGSVAIDGPSFAPRPHWPDPCPRRYTHTPFSRLNVLRPFARERWDRLNRRLAVTRGNVFWYPAVSLASVARGLLGARLSHAGQARRSLTAPVLATSPLVHPAALVVLGTAPSPRPLDARRSPGVAGFELRRDGPGVWLAGARHSGRATSRARIPVPSTRLAGARRSTGVAGFEPTIRRLGTSCPLR